MKSLKAARVELEARVEEARAKEQAAFAAANALRSDLGLPALPSQASEADDKKVRWGVLGHPPLLANWVRGVPVPSSLLSFCVWNASVHMSATTPSSSLAEGASQ